MKSPTESLPASQSGEDDLERSVVSVELLAPHSTYNANMPLQRSSGAAHATIDDPLFPEEQSPAAAAAASVEIFSPHSSKPRSMTSAVTGLSFQQKVDEDDSQSSPMQATASLELLPSRSNSHSRSMIPFAITGLSLNHANENKDPLLVEQPTPSLELLSSHSTNLNQRGSNENSILSLQQQSTELSLELLSSRSSSLVRSVSLPTTGMSLHQGSENSGQLHEQSVSTHSDDTLQSPLSSSQVNSSATSIESIGKISESVDLLSPIATNGERNRLSRDLRFSMDATQPSPQPASDTMEKSTKQTSTKNGSNTLSPILHRSLEARATNSRTGLSDDNDDIRARIELPEAAKRVFMSFECDITDATEDENSSSMRRLTLCPIEEEEESGDSADATDKEAYNVSTHSHSTLQSYTNGSFQESVNIPAMVATETSVPSSASLWYRYQSDDDGLLNESAVAIGSRSMERSRIHQSLCSIEEHLEEEDLEETEAPSVDSPVTEPLRSPWYDDSCVPSFSIQTPENMRTPGRSESINLASPSVSALLNSVAEIKASSATKSDRSAENSYTSQSLDSIEETEPPVKQLRAFLARDDSSLPPFASSAPLDVGLPSESADGYQMDKEGIQSVESNEMQHATDTKEPSVEIESPALVAVNKSAVGLTTWKRSESTPCSPPPVHGSGSPEDERRESDASVSSEQHLSIQADRSLESSASSVCSDGTTTQAESARSMALIQRLRSAAFRRSMNSFSFESTSLSLLEDEDVEVQVPPRQGAVSVEIGDNSSGSMSSRTSTEGTPEDAKEDSPQVSQPDSSTDCLNDRELNNNRVDMAARDPLFPAPHVYLNVERNPGQDSPKDFVKSCSPECTKTACNIIAQHQRFSSRGGDLEESSTVPFISHSEVDSLVYSSKSRSHASEKDFSSRSSSSESNEQSVGEVSILDKPLDRGACLSNSSFRSGDILKTQKGLGASSMEFIEQLRGAAFRRKMNLTRSRDSLVSKEKQQREDIAAAEAARLARADQERQSAVAQGERRRSAKAILPQETFKARAMPKTTGLLGNGGLSGVPKVEKKPTTTPNSPYLGARRQLRKSIDPESKGGSPFPSRQTQGHSRAGSFKARPLPKSTGRFGGAGQAGVPKVAKREVTVPESPLLGSRRRAQIRPPLQIRGRSKQDNALRRPSTDSHSSSSSSLIGLGLYGLKENEELVAATPARKTVVFPKAYIPHSTERARKRSNFEARRSENEQRRKEEERLKRKQTLKALEKELDKLRMQL